MIDHSLNFSICGRAFFHDSTDKIQHFTSEWVVKVNLYLIIRDGKYLSHKAVAVLILQRDDSTFIDIIRIELTFDAEDVLVKIYNAFIIVFAVSFFLLQSKIKFIVFFELDNIVPRKLAKPWRDQR